MSDIQWTPEMESASHLKEKEDQIAVLENEIFKNQKKIEHLLDKVEIQKNIYRDALRVVIAELSNERQ